MQGGFRLSSVAVGFLVNVAVTFGLVLLVVAGAYVTLGTTDEELTEQAIENLDSTWHGCVMLIVIAMGGAVLGGRVAARLSPDAPTRHALVLGAAALVYAFFFLEDSDPGWVRVMGLALIVPAAWLGGRRRPAGLQRAAVMDWLQNLRVGGAVALGRAVPPVRFRVSADQIAGFVALHVALAVASSWLLAQPPRLFDLAGAAVQALIFVTLLLLAWASARETRPERLAATLLVLLAALWPLWLALSLQALVPREWRGDDFGWVTATVQGCSLIWGLGVLMRALEVGCGLAGVRAFALAALCATGVLGLVNAIEVEPYWSTDWYAIWQQEQEEEPEEEIDAEALMFAQHEMLQGAAAGLAPQRPGITDLYFLGFASDASQAVFRREVEATRTLFDTRFDTASRSVALVNHVETREQLPIASGSNLGFMLREMGARMDTDEDVLFLFLTGHGSKQHELAVRFSDLPLNSIGPESLGGLLDAAGIRWRVIVVSACYSGGFIDDLANEWTLLLTAAAADRSSFGCSNEAEWTWFGRAFFAEALADEIDFELAFEQARTRIAEREKADGKTPSQPQMVVGAAIRAKLEFLEARLSQALADGV